MRVLAVLVALPLLVGSVATASAADDPLAPLAGRWRCTTIDGRFADRSYFLHEAAFGPRAGSKEVYGRDDFTDASGAARTATERISENGPGAVVESTEGTAAASALSLPLTFSSQVQNQPFSLTYTVSGNTMERTVSRGNATVADDRCVRQPDPAPPAGCTAQPVLTSVVRQANPIYPKAALDAKARGTVNVRVIMDDQSRVLWTEVIDSSSPLLTDAALQAARDSTYRTMTVNCAPIPSEEKFTVSFG